MKAELRTKWLTGLRSGEYEQGDGYLEKDGRYCCMGVLCDVAKVPRDPDDYFIFSDGRSSNATIFGELRAQINGSRAETLAHMNDNGKSFAEIADWIETHIPEEAS